MPIWKSEILDYIDQRANEIHRSALRNEVMWGKLNWFYHPEEYTWEKCIEDMKYSFNEQLEWMDSNLK